MSGKSWQDPSAKEVDGRKFYKFMLTQWEAKNLTVDDIFTHEHFITNPDGLGQFAICSTFVLKNAPHTAVVTQLLIRAHDDIRDNMFFPDEEKHCRDIFQHVCGEMKAEFAYSLLKVPYKVCTRLVKDCLVRQLASGKAVSKDERDVVDMYCIRSADDEYIIPQTMCPAPDRESLWLLLSRTEFHFWQFEQDLEDATSIPKDCTKEEFIQLASRHISSIAYVRRRVICMLEYTAMWLELRNEVDCAQWLRCEARSLQTVEGVAAVSDSADEGIVATLREKFENSFVVQTILNKIRSEDISFVTPWLRLGPKTTAHSDALSNYFRAQADFSLRGDQLHPNLIIPALVATAACCGMSDCDCVAGECSLKCGTRRCAICGITSRMGDDPLSSKPLMRCSKCLKVSYCGTEHQKLHWKNGHKAECSSNT